MKLSKKTKYIIGTVLAIVFVTIVSFLVIQRYNRGLEVGQNTGQSPESISNLDSTEKVEITRPPKYLTPPNPEHKLEVGGWLPEWASDTGLESMKKTPQKLNSVSPVWYEINSDGSLKSKFPKQSSEITKIASQKKMQLIPTVATFDHNLLGGILQDNTKLQNHVDSIVAEVEKRKYAGIDLDYESKRLMDKEKYFEFLQKLSAELKSRGKILAVSVIAKWGDDVIYSSLPETREVQDWERIGLYADELRIMAYDYTHSSAKSPGPIAPVSWVKKVIEYALDKVPAEKIVLGLHLYSYEWWALDPEKNSEKDILESDNTTARSYPYRIVEQMLDLNAGEPTEYEGEKFFSYNFLNPRSQKYENRTLVYVAPEGVKTRADLAKHYNLKGIIFWRLGEESSLLSQI